VSLSLPSLPSLDSYVDIWQFARYSQFSFRSSSISDYSFIKNQLSEHIRQSTRKLYLQTGDPKFLPIYADLYRYYDVEPNPYFRAFDTTLGLQNVINEDAGKYTTFPGPQVGTTIACLLAAAIHTNIYGSEFELYIHDRYFSVFGGLNFSSLTIKPASARPQGKTFATFLKDNKPTTPELFCKIMNECGAQANIFDKFHNYIDHYLREWSVSVGLENCDAFLPSHLSNDKTLHLDLQPQFIHPQLNIGFNTFRGEVESFHDYVRRGLDLPSLAFLCRELYKKGVNIFIPNYMSSFELPHTILLPSLDESFASTLFMRTRFSILLMGSSGAANINGLLPLNSFVINPAPGCEFTYHPNHPIKYLRSNLYQDHEQQDFRGQYYNITASKPTLSNCELLVSSFFKATEAEIISWANIISQSG